MTDLLTDRIKISDHFLRRWKDRVENLDCEEKAEAFYGKPRDRITDDEWMNFVVGSGVNTTGWKIKIRETIGAVPYSGRVVVGCWEVITRRGVAITVKWVEGGR